MVEEQQYNLRSPAVKRILREAAELKDSTYEYFAQPLEDNIFEWHFTVRGAADTDFCGGYYHGRIILPNDYPMKPPSIILLTPNGRFEVRKKICLSISGYHPESWQPCWSIRTVLLAIIAFMPTKAEGSIGSIDYTPTERARLARQSHRWNCPNCGSIKTHLKESPSPQQLVESKSDQEFLQKVSFKGEITKGGNPNPDIGDTVTDNANHTQNNNEDKQNRDNEAGCSISSNLPPPLSLSSVSSVPSLSANKPTDNSAVSHSTNNGPSSIIANNNNNNGSVVDLIPLAGIAPHHLSSLSSESSEPAVDTATPDPAVVSEDNLAGANPTAANTDQHNNNNAVNNNSNNNNVLIHGPIVNFFLHTIIVIIVALLLRRIYYFYL